MTVPTEAERLFEVLAKQVARAHRRSQWTLGSQEWITETATAILAAGYRFVGPGDVVVPREATERMSVAGGEAQQRAIDSWGEPVIVYNAMLAAHEKEKSDASHPS